MIEWADSGAVVAAAVLASLVEYDRRLKLEFRGSKVISDAVPFHRVRGRLFRHLLANRRYNNESEDEMIEWYVKGREFVNCNCDYGCPCQFNALPTHGDCRAMASYQIEEGRFGDAVLDGTVAVFTAKWPGPIHEGNGTQQLIVDEAASEAQRDALLKIMSGQETEPMTTMWSVFAAMTTAFLDPLVRPIELEIDVDARRGRLSVPNVIFASGEPIRNPVTGDEHRARIDLPHGFEYRLAEIGSATTETGSEAGVELMLDNSYGQFAEIQLSHTGRMN